MKTTRFISENYQTVVVALVFTFTLWGCNQSLDKSDVQDKIEDAQEATREAKQETQEAVEAREEYTADYKKTKVAELDTRSKEIDKRIQDLEKTVKNSSNKAATADIQSAIIELQKEKQAINEKIKDVKALEAQDWSTSYEETNKGITRIEGELDKLSKSLENKN